MHSVLITGASGGIGAALVAAYKASGWRVIATDCRECASCEADLFLPADLEKLASDDDALEEFAAQVRAGLIGAPLCILVNNAAAQILGSASAVALEDWERSLRVNLTAPFRLAQALLPELTAAKGTIINIGSVHAQATKPGFVAYATTKAALHGLTRALAVDLGASVRVICLAPAAISTSMLQVGFEGRAQEFAELAAAHPAGRVGDPAEVGRAAVALSGDAFSFATGSTFWLDGGILSRLHDPV